MQISIQNSYHYFNMINKFNQKNVNNSKKKENQKEINYLFHTYCTLKLIFNDHTIHSKYVMQAKLM